MSRGARILVTFCLVAGLIALYLRGTFPWRGVVDEPPSSDEIRIATWNTGWLLEDVREDRCRRMTKVIDELSADVLALQEVESRLAVRKILPKGYDLAIIDDPREDQELALAFRFGITLLRKPELLFASSKYDDAFPSRRNALEVALQFPNGDEMVFIVIHYKSRSGGRIGTDESRIGASRLLVDYLKRKKYEHAVILGDFNDTPGDESLDVLETGNAFADAGKPFFVNLLEESYRRDYVSQGFFRKFRGVASAPQVRGAFRDNERLRGKDYMFPRDVQVTQALFDQILVTPNLTPRVNEVKIFSGIVAMAGRETQVDRDKTGEAVIEAHGTLPSDHLPVYVDFSADARESTAFPK